MNTIPRAVPTRTLSTLPLSICHQCLLRTPRPTFRTRTRPSPPPHRAASTTSTTGGEGKPIVLEPPDKFRPPSHPARLNRPRRSPAAYNQGATREERQSQKTRTYPHMFPNSGTFMHWFLSDRKIHLWITMGTLTILATITTTITFLRTSPYSHLIPPLSSLPLHPLTYISETLSVLRLHIDYETQRTNDSRQQKILDAQKRRLYRRAHGLEDLNAEHDQGIDVRGLVSWDDGLTNKERERGGRETILSGADMVRLGMEEGEDQLAFTRRLEGQGERLKLLKEKGVEFVIKKEAEEAARRGREAGEVVDAVEGGEGVEQARPVQQERRKRKLWLGIW